MRFLGRSELDSVTTWKFSKATCCWFSLLLATAQQRKQISGGEVQCRASEIYYRLFLGLTKPDSLPLISNDHKASIVGYYVSCAPRYRAAGVRFTPNLFMRSPNIGRSLLKTTMALPSEIWSVTREGSRIVLVFGVEYKIKRGPLEAGCHSPGERINEPPHPHRVYHGGAKYWSKYLAVRSLMKNIKLLNIRALGRRNINWEGHAENSKWGRQESGQTERGQPQRSAKIKKDLS